jgi:hypothetical protein
VKIAPVLRANARQAKSIRTLRHTTEMQSETIADLQCTLARIRSDVELLGACIPHERRALALALVRDRHRIEDDPYQHAFPRSLP